MFYKILKKNIFIFKTLIWFKLKLNRFLRLKDVFIMMVMFYFFPKQMHKFSTRKLLPNNRNRYFKSEKSTIPYDLLKSKSSEIPQMEEINIVGPGQSFNLNDLKKMNGKTFLMTFWTPLKINGNGDIIYRHPKDWEEGFRSDFYKFYWEEGKNYWLDKDKDDAESWEDFKKDDLTYVLSRKHPLKLLRKNGYKILGVGIHDIDKNGNYFPYNKDWDDSSDFNLMNDNDCKHISVVQKIYKSPLNEMKSINNKKISGFVPSGSFLPGLCALTYFAKKINVYGWDFYLNISPEKMKSWELFLNMYNYKHDLSTSQNHFESALLNFYYAYQISKLPNVNIHGHLGKLDKHKKLISRIEKVLFN